jgi:hypothetical protein
MPKAIAASAHAALVAAAPLDKHVAAQVREVASTVGVERLRDELASALETFTRAASLHKELRVSPDAITPAMHTLLGVLAARLAKAVMRCPTQAHARDRVRDYLRTRELASFTDAANWAARESEWTKTAPAIPEDLRAHFGVMAKMFPHQHLHAEVVTHLRSARLWSSPKGVSAFD